MENKTSLKTKFLFSGDMFFGNIENPVHTILGSCVSVIIYDRKKRLGGITHSVLPDCMKKNCLKNNCPDYAKSTECSIEKLLKLFEDQESKISDLEFFIFGGAELIYPEDSTIKY